MQIVIFTKQTREVEIINLPFTATAVEPFETDKTIQVSAVGFVTIADCADIINKIASL